MSTALANLRTDLTSILILCSKGLDVQARCLLRNYIEKVDLLICLKYDKNLSESYVENSSFEGSRDFFYKFISGGKLVRRARDILKREFPNEDILYDWLLTDWRRQTGLMLSAASHPTHTVSLISLFPNLGRGRSNAIGLEGHPTNGSNLTITKAFTASMPLYFIFSDFQRDQSVQFLEELNVSTEWMDDWSKLDKLILAFTLLDTWLSDPQSATDFSQPLATSNGERAF